MDASYGPPVVQNSFAGMASVTDPIDANGIVPKKFWVSPNGTDGDANGRPDAPFKTITFGLTKCTAAQGNVLFVGPGSYAENVNVNVSNVAIIGTGGRHTGLTQIIGDGVAATTTATVYVGAGYLSGFRLSNIELDTNGVTKPALHLVTSDTGATPLASAAYYRGLVDNVAVRSNDPSVALLLEGTTLCNFRGLYINGPRLGIAFAGSAQNMPSDLLFEDTTFINGFSNTAAADICTVQTINNPLIIGGGPNLTNVIFKRTDHHSVGTGAGGVTNFINLAANMTALNVNFYDSNFPRAVTNGTNGIATLPANIRVIGWGNSTTRIAIAS